MSDYYIYIDVGPHLWALGFYGPTGPCNTCGDLRNGEQKETLSGLGDNLTAEDSAQCEADHKRELKEDR